MTLLMTLLLIVYVLILIWKACFAKDLEFFEFFPSFMWASIMVVPLIFQTPTFDQEFILTQSIGTSLFFIIFFLGDSIRIRRLSIKGLGKKVDLWKIALALLAISFPLQIYHLYKMPQIPLMAKLQEVASNFSPLIFKQLPTNLNESAHYMMLREASSKNLSINPLLLYVMQSTLTVAIPIVLLFLFRLKKYMLFIFTLLIVIFYSRSTLAKAPLYIFCFSFLIMVIPLINKRTLRIILKTFSVTSVFLMGFICYFLVFNTKSLFYLKIPQKHRAECLSGEKPLRECPRIITLGDKYRFGFNPEGTKNIFQKNVNFFMYRIFLVPSEVSHHWYTFFPKINNGHLGWYGLSQETRNSSSFQHPANRLGLWAYNSRFPEKYFKTIRAYTSIDSDAYARWGYLGFIFISLTMLLLRLYWKWIRIDGQIGRAIYYLGLIIIGINVCQGSLFAILVSQGFFPLLIFTTTLRFIGSNRID
ncbi:hypothetical protein OAQ84_00140 [Bdellovibrionales bacterium]|nr:hypothetical protein [Bdellovibrionales bacterium]